MIIGRCTKSVLALAVLALSFTACKDDDNPNPDGGSNGNEKAFIPTKDKVYRYKTTDSEGEGSTSVTKVTSVQDSAGLQVYKIREVLTQDGEDFDIDYKAYSHDGLTTNELSYPPALIAMVNEMSQMAYIEDLSVTGFPQFQNLENKGTVNSQLTYKGDPIKLKMKLQIPVGEDDIVNAQLEAKITHKSGKATKQESVTTPAGTFDCTKWEYTYEVYTKMDTEIVPLEEKTVVYTVSLWTSPGVGVVKTIEKSEDSTSTTELQKID